MEEKNENVVEETTQETNEQVEETTQIDESKFESAGDDNVIKVDLNNPPQEKESEEPVVETTSEVESQPEVETQETPVLEEITEEEVEEIAEEASEAIKENLETGKPLPENIQKLIDFCRLILNNLD